MVFPPSIAKRINTRLFVCLSKRMKMMDFIDKPAYIAMATLIVEMIRQDKCLNNEMLGWMESMPPECRAERCDLEEEQANLLLSQSLNADRLEVIARYLMQAIDLGDAANEAQQSRLRLKLIAVQLALGNVPVSGEGGLHIPLQLVDIVIALRASHIPLFDAAVKNNAVFLVESKIHNAIMFARSRLQLLMVVKFYMHLLEKSLLTDGAMKRPAKINVNEMILFYQDVVPIASREEMLSWLLPLLVDAEINGVMSEDTPVILISTKDPFASYAVEVLEAEVERRIHEQKGE